MKRVTVYQIAVALFLCMNLAVPPGLIAQGTPGETAQEGPPAFRPEEIDQLVAPIALYPDDLLAQVLAASTYPLEVVQAARFLEQNKNLKGEKLMEASKDKDWDPSVKAMLQFPDVLAMMNEKLEWTQKLGDAFLDQQGDVMSAVQRLRRKADESGNLKTTTEQKVIVQKETQTIIIQPANPQVVYVPTYSPTVVYGVWPYPAYPPYPVYPPGYVAGAALFSFGVGVAVGAAWGGYGGWGCGWGNTTININNSRYNNFTRNNYVNAQRYQNNQNIKNQNWQHNPQHRGSAQYRNQATAEKYGQQRPGSMGRASTSEARGYGGGAGSGGKPQTSDRSRGTGAGGGGRPQTGNLSRGTGAGGGGKPQPSNLSRGTGTGTGGGRENAMSGAGSGGSERASSYRGQQSRGSASPSTGGAARGASRGSGGSRGGSTGR